MTNGRPERAPSHRYASIAAIGLSLVVISAFGTASSIADENRLENLHVYPPDTTEKSLVAEMREIGNALGVGCEHCHFASSGAQFGGFDFASDANPKKSVARGMMRMTRAINEEHLERDGASAVTCWTCHRGEAIPAGVERAVADATHPTGAALATEGYVDDATCSACHRDIAASFPTIGMSRAFYRPTPERLIEDFSKSRYFHEPSKRHYEMKERDGRLFLERYERAPGGEKRNVLELEAHWILGSGSNARTYIHQTEWGELYQLPLSWYTRTASWRMSPGYDNADHQGFTRRIQRDCLFCHNAYPEVAVGSDVFGEPQIFPPDLPEGLGCQRCHGPGAEHVEAAMTAPAGDDRVRETIVNPGRLEPKLRDDVCLQCHLQPSVTLSGVRRFDRPMYSFRPGESIDDYIVYLETVEDRPEEERFEINHHPYRLRQSLCFLESEPGELSCLTCHDPHRKRTGAEAESHYRAACLGCHEVSELRTVPSSAEELHTGEGRCASCHMPRQRTQDVIETTMTDHRIQRTPGGPELLAPLTETVHRIRGVELLHPEYAPPEAEAEIYRSLAMARGGSRAAVDRLGRALAKHPVDETEPYLQLALGQLESGRFADAEHTLHSALERDPDHVTARVHLGIALAGQGRADAAEEALRRALASDPDRPEVRYNLGKLLAQSGRREEGLEHLHRAVELRPIFAAGWLDIGNAFAQSGDYAKAAEAYRRALAVEPGLAPAQHRLIEALRRDGREQEAARETAAWVALHGAQQP